MDQSATDAATRAHGEDGRPEPPRAPAGRPGAVTRLLWSCAGADGGLLERCPQSVDRLANLLAQHADRRAAIEVHTDSSHAAGAPRSLALARGEVLMGRLVERGRIAPERLVLEPVGGERLLVPGDGRPSEQVPNRPIELRALPPLTRS